MSVRDVAPANLTIIYQCNVLMIAHSSHAYIGSISNLFVIFDTVLAEGGITAASRKRSQPAVGHALTRLRGLLGDPLFQRQGRAMVRRRWPVHRRPVRAALRNIGHAAQRALRSGQQRAPLHPGLPRRAGLILVPPLMQALVRSAATGLIAARMNGAAWSPLFAGRVDIGIACCRSRRNPF